MTQRPARVVVDGVTVKVEWDKSLGTRGFFDLAGTHEDNRIRISRGMTNRQQQATLVHELLHHLWERATLTHKFSARQEETVIDSLSGWLLQTLRDNQDLLAYLTATEKVR